LGGVGENHCTYAEESVRLVTPLLKDNDPDVVAAAAMAIHRRGNWIQDSVQEAAELLVGLTGHSSTDVRRAVASALATIQFRVLDTLELARLYRALIGLSRDTERDVRIEAVTGLAFTEHETEDILVALRERTGDQDGEVRAVALLGLAHQNDPQLVELLINELSGNDDYVYDDTLDAARLAADSRLIPILTALKDDGIDGMFMDEALKACSASD